MPIRYYTKSYRQNLPSQCISITLLVQYWMFEFNPEPQDASFVSLPVPWQSNPEKMMGYSLSVVCLDEYVLTNVQMY